MPAEFNLDGVLENSSLAEEGLLRLLLSSKPLKRKKTLIVSSTMLEKDFDKTNYLEQADIVEPAYLPKKHYSAVLMVNQFRNLENPEQVYRAIAKILNTKGVFVNAEVFRRDEAEQASKYFASLYNAGFRSLYKDTARTPDITAYLLAMKKQGKTRNNAYKDLNNTN